MAEQSMASTPRNTLMLSLSKYEEAALALRQAQGEGSFGER